MAGDDRRERGGGRRGGRGDFRGGSPAGRGRFGKRREGDDVRGERRERGPRRDDDRRPRREGGDARGERRERGPRRDDFRGERRERGPRREGGSRRDDFRGERRERGPRRDDDRRPRRFRDEDDTPKNAAQQRRAEVFARKGPRKYGKEKPFAPRQDREERVVDEGSIRGRRFEKGHRGRDDRSRHDDRREPGSRRAERGGPKARRSDRNSSPFPAIPALPDDLAREVKKAVGDRRFGYVSRQLSRALVAYDAERYKEALNVLRPVLEDLWLISEVRVLAGRLEYRSQHWKAAAEHLEFSRASDRADMTNLPVLIDCYRALKRYELVDELWTEMKEHSPHPTVMAEGRVSAAMSYADRGDVQSAIRIMTHGGEPREVQPHHLLEWYVLGDLHDRAGDQVTAKKYFARVAKNDASYFDVAARLAGLGE